MVSPRSSSARKFASVSARPEGARGTGEGRRRGVVVALGLLSSALSVSCPRPHPTASAERAPRSSESLGGPSAAATTSLDSRAADDSTPSPKSSSLRSSSSDHGGSAAWAQRKRGLLEVPEFYPAELWVPSGGGSKPMRLLVVAHGAGGRGVDHCVHWDRLMPPDVALLCLAGKPLRTADPDGGSYFPDHLALRAELDAALSAAQQGASGLRPASERWFLGYSQGATMGALAIVGEIDFAHLLLIEGGSEHWTSQRARAFFNRGGRSVFLACGTQGCAGHAARSVPFLEGAGLGAASFVDLTMGHAYWGKLGEEAAEHLTRAAGSSEKEP